MSDFPAHISIDGREIGPGRPCYVIAEAGVNHFGEVPLAYQLVDLAIHGKADIFKTQHYNVEKLIGPTSMEWRDRLREKQLSDQQICKIQQYAQQCGMGFLCTPHEEDALNFIVKELDVPAIKVGSGEVGNWKFLEKVASYERPVVLSTGMHRIEDIKEAILVLEESGCRSLAVLHCVSVYPTPSSIVNLSVMDQIRSIFPGPVGYSDHTAGTAVSLAAVALGADIIEKHITIKTNVPNAQDWKVSCGPDNFGKFVQEIREIEDAKGGGEKSITNEEIASISWARKSLTAAYDLPAYTKVTEDMILRQRPGTGLPASQFDAVIGRVTSRQISAGALLSEDDLLSNRVN